MLFDPLAYLTRT